MWKNIFIGLAALIVCVLLVRACSSKEVYWITGSDGLPNLGYVHNSDCSSYGVRLNGSGFYTKKIAVPYANCKRCGGRARLNKGKENYTYQQRYWISTNSKLHNRSCRYYGYSDKGHYTSYAPIYTVDCKICGGANR